MPSDMHRKLMEPAEEFWRNYQWQRDYVIKNLNKGKNKIKYDKKLSIARIFPKYMKNHGYKIHFIFYGFKYTTVWYSK